MTQRVIIDRQHRKLARHKNIQLATKKADTRGVVRPGRAGGSSTIGGKSNAG